MSLQWTGSVQDYILHPDITCICTSLRASEGLGYTFVVPLWFPIGWFFIKRFFIATKVESLLKYVQNTFKYVQMAFK